MSNTGPILFFDSGVGGLSIVSATHDVLPTAPFIYAADSAGFPYGTKSEDEIASRVPALLGRLVERYRPRLVVIACNTASTIALSTVRSALDLPIVGTVPAIKPAALISKTRVIGLLGTEATVRQPYVDRLTDEFAPDCEVIRYGSAELVLLAEAKLRGETVDPGTVREAITGMFAHPRGDEIDVVVLACTHFPLIEQELAVAAPRGVTFVDGSAGIARRIVHLTSGHAWPIEKPPGIAVFTRIDESTMALAPALAKRGFPTIVAL